MSGAERRWRVAAAQVLSGGNSKWRGSGKRTGGAVGARGRLPPGWHFSMQKSQYYKYISVMSRINERKQE